MARNKEHVESMLNRYINMKIEEKQGSKQRRPYALDCGDLSEAGKWREQIMRDISRKVMDIQNEGLGEHLVRDLNDEINKLLHEKLHCERRIIDLGGPNYIKHSSKTCNGDNDDVAEPSHRYRYFGAMKKLNGVRELFETKLPESRKRRKTCDDIINTILEELERLAIDEKVSEWDDDMEAIRGEARRGAKSALAAAKFLLEEEDKENGEEKFMMRMPLPDEKELQRTLVKKLKLSSKYASRDLLEEQRETKAMLNI